MRHSFNGNYGVTRKFGIVDPAYSNYPGSKHPGTDYGVPANTQLVAGMGGVVTIIDRDPTLHTGRGKEVRIKRDNLERRECHMNRIDVANGQVIAEGQPIGLSGYTGYVVDANGGVGTPGGAHLHDELLVSGQYTDLEEYLKQGETVAFIEPATIRSLFAEFEVPGPTNEQVDYYSKHQGGYTELYKDLLYYKRNEVRNLENQATGEYKPYEGKDLFIKK